MFLDIIRYSIIHKQSTNRAWMDYCNFLDDFWMANRDFLLYSDLFNLSSNI